MTTMVMAKIFKWTSPQILSPQTLLQMMNIASKMSSDNMTKFAEKFLNIKHNQWGYNYALLKHWRKYAGENAKQVSVL